MSWLIGFVLLVPAFAALSLSMQKHQRSAFGASLPEKQVRLYRWLGFGLVTIAALWCVAAFNWALGLTILFGLATLSSLLVIGLLTLRPKLVRYLCWVPRQNQSRSSG